ncbi:MAG: carboxypeptidase-like regulatory domain-containing protein [Planctomycetota bacterium]
MRAHAKRRVLMGAVLAIAAACAVAWLLTRPVRVIQGPKVEDGLTQRGAPEELRTGRGPRPDGAAAPTLEGLAPEALLPLRGQIVDDRTGRPIAGVQVIGSAAWEAPRRHVAKTQEDGSYELPLQVDSYLLTTWRDGYVPAGLTKWLAPQSGFRTSRFHEVHVMGREDHPDLWAPAFALARASARAWSTRPALRSPVPMCACAATEAPCFKPRSRTPSSRDGGRYVHSIGA